MVSLAVEQWPDTILPATTAHVTVPKGSQTTLRVAPQHLFHAWSQISLELAKLPCQVVCHFKNECIKKTLVYGVRTMPLRIGEMVAHCNIRGFQRHADGALDILCTATDPKYHCATGYRAAPHQVAEVEIRTAKGSLRLQTLASDASDAAWFALDTADELSCWLWSVCRSEHARPTHRLDIDHLLTENMRNILN